MERAPIPVIFSAHHASDSFAYRNFAARTALTPGQQKRFSDYGTAESVPTNGLLTLRSKHSRGLVDLSRRPGDRQELYPERDFGKPEAHLIWRPGLAPDEDERSDIWRNIYFPYHDELSKAIKKFQREGVVIGWDNTADYIIGISDAGDEVKMQDIILSNGGDEESTDGFFDQITCDPNFLRTFGEYFQQSLVQNGFDDIEIHYNLVFKAKNSFIVQNYTSRRNPDLRTDFPVQSFQVEYNTALTHDQTTLEPLAGRLEAMRNAAETAFGQSIS